MNNGSEVVTFSRLQLSKWRQFGVVDLEFHPELTVLTGANSSGKTTILGLLSQHFSWNITFLGSPKKNSGGGLTWQSGSTADSPGNIGELTYSNGQSTPLFAPDGQQSYSIQIQSQAAVAGLYLISHRQVGAYKAVESIPPKFSASEQLFTEYWQEVTAKFFGNYTPKSAMLRLKEALIAAAIYGEGNGAVESNPEALSVWTGYQQVLKAVLPPTLGYRQLIVRSGDIVIQSATGDFLIDAVSGGVSSIIEISWQIFLRSRDYEWFTVVIDEPENHLHPELQRSLIPQLLKAFPHVRFIIATHSPFIVNAVRDSNVYVLDYEEGRVNSRLLDTVSKAASSDEVLRRVLGLETTAPLWVEDEIEKVLARYASGTIDAHALRTLRDELYQIGLGNQFPSALDALTRWTAQ